MKMFRNLFLIAIAFAGVLNAQTVSNQYRSIKANWTAPVIGPTNASVYPACNFSASPAVNTYCVNGYQEILTPPAGTNANTVTIPPCNSAQTSACIPWGGSSYIWTPGGFLYVGTWGISLSVGYLDGNGIQQLSAPLAGSAVVPNPTNPPSPATGLNVTVTP